MLLKLADEILGGAPIDATAGFNPIFKDRVGKSEYLGPVVEAFFDNSTTYASGWEGPERVGREWYLAHPELTQTVPSPSSHLSQARPWSPTTTPPSPVRFFLSGCIMFCDHRSS